MRFSTVLEQALGLAPSPRHAFRTAKRLGTLSLLTLAIASNNVWAGPWHPDSTFGVNGIALTTFAPSASARAFARLPDGRIVVCGSADGQIALAMLTPSGAVDSTFGTAGTVLAGPGTAGALIVQGGYLLVAADSLRVLRFDLAGQLDPSFTSVGLSTGIVVNATGIAALQGGQLLAGGTLCCAPFGAPTGYMVRLQAEGALDTTYGVNGIVSAFNAPIETMAALSDGAVIFSGTSLGIFAHADFVLKYNASGVREWGSSADWPGPYDRGGAVAVRGDARIVEGGFTSSGEAALALYHPTGIIDSTFGVDGRFFSGQTFSPTRIWSLDNGNVRVAGLPGFGILGVTSGGVLDTAISPSGMVALSFPGTSVDVLAQPDGKVLTLGTHDGEFAVVRYTDESAPPSSSCPISALCVGPSRFRVSGGSLAGDEFGNAVARLRDLDGDGTTEILVGESQDSQGGPQRGAVWICFLDPMNGQVRSMRKIGSSELPGLLDNGDLFGYAAADIGDLDGDGIHDVAVTSPGDDDGATNAGAVWILFLNTDGTVKASQKISATAGGLSAPLSAGSSFGLSICSVGDLDRNGSPEIAVGGLHDSLSSGTHRGALWILGLDSLGNVTSERRVTEGTSGFLGVLDDYDSFGRSISLVGDVDRDGNPDLAVGATGDDDGVGEAGAIWLLFMNPDGTVARHAKISATSGSFGGSLDYDDDFGISLTAIGDVTGDGVPDLCAGAVNDDDGGPDRGALWVLALTEAGTVAQSMKLSDLVGCLADSMTNGQGFGISVANVGDLDGDGCLELAIGVNTTDDVSTNSGSFWVAPLVDRSALLNVDESGAGEVRVAHSLPNPSRAHTTIAWRLPRSASVDITIHGVRGDLVTRSSLGVLSAGEHQFKWDGRDQRGRAVPPGVYFASVLTEQRSEGRTRIVLIR